MFVMFMKKFKLFIKEEKKFIISLCILMIGQAFLYWSLKLFQSNPIYINYYLDDKIPFCGYFVYIYNMFYPFCVVAYYFLYKADARKYFKAIFACAIGIIICDTIFLALPTIMYRPPIPSYDAFTNLVIKVTFFFDEPPLNCFPSIHCLFCFQVIFGYIKSKATLSKKIIMITISLLIIISTLLVKQHFIFDVVGALVVCIMANILENLFGIYDKLKKKLKI